MIITDWRARHDLSSGAYQLEFDNLVSAGYRLVKVSGYLVGNQPHFAGIWQRRGGLDWQARHGISEDAYQRAITELGHMRYRPTYVSVFGQDGEARFSAVWEREWGIPWIARHGLTSEEYQQLFNGLSAQGYRLRCVSGYELDGVARYACIWDRYAGPAWQARHGLDSATYQQEFDELVRQGYRLIQVAGYAVHDTDHYAAVWEQSPGHGWQARHGIAASNYQAEFDQMVEKGYRLVDVSGFSALPDARYTTIWEDASADQPGEDPVNALVIPFMQEWAVPGLSFSVRQRGRRITRCFGYANMITREIVIPSTRFRIASVTKPITATAIFQLIEQGRLHLGDRVFGPVSVLGTSSVLGTRFGTLPYGPHIEDITIQHLLEHTAGGWQNDSQDPMFQRLDLNQEQLISWTLDHRPLLYPPGTVFLYSNFGYCVLGRVIEEVSGMSYRDYIHQFVLGRSGVNDMEIAGNGASERQSGEAMYVGKDFEPDLSVPYGLPVSRMDSHGGWIATPTDLLEFLVRVDGFRIPPDLLSAVSIGNMTSPSVVNPGYARGWAVNASGTRWHDGLLPGTHSILVRTAQQHEWAALCNTGKAYTNLGVELDRLMWQVDGVL